MGIICTFLLFGCQEKQGSKASEFYYLRCSIKVHLVKDMSMKIKIWVLWRVRDSVSLLTAATKDIKSTESEEDEPHEEDEEEAQNQRSLNMFLVPCCQVLTVTETAFFGCPLRYGDQNLCFIPYVSWLFGIIGSIYRWIAMMGITPPGWGEWQWDHTTMAAAEKLSGSGGCANQQLEAAKWWRCGCGFDKKTSEAKLKAWLIG